MQSKYNGIDDGTPIATSLVYIIYGEKHIEERRVSSIYPGEAYTFDLFNILEIRPMDAWDAAAHTSSDPQVRQAAADDKWAKELEDDVAFAILFQEMKGGRK